MAYIIQWIIDLSAFTHHKSFPALRFRCTKNEAPRPPEEEDDDRHLVVAGLVAFRHICGLIAICVWIGRHLPVARTGTAE